MSSHLTPLNVCELLIGRPEALAPICGVDPKTPYGWRNPSKSRAAGDLPGAIHQRALLAHSNARGLGLTAEHLIWGAPAAEIEEILSRRVPAVAAE